MNLLSRIDTTTLCDNFFTALFTSGRLEEAASFLSEDISWYGDTELYSATGKGNVLQLLSFAITYYQKSNLLTLGSFHEQVLTEGVTLVAGTISLETSGSEKTNFNVAALCAKKDQETHICSVQFHLQKKSNQSPLDGYLSSLFDVMPCGILFFEYTNNESKMVYINDFASTLLGYHREALQGLKGSDLSKLVSASDTAAITEMFNVLLQDPMKTKAEHKAHVQTKHGERWFYAVCHVLNRTTDKTYFVISIVDITQEIDDHAKFRNTIENLPASVCTFEVIDDVLWQHYISNSFPETLGYPAENFRDHILSPEFPLIHRDDVEGLRKNYREMMMGAASIDVTFRAKKQNGQYIWCNMIAKRFPGNAGNPLYYGIYSDVDEKICALHALAKAKNELEKVITSLPGGVAIFQQLQD